MVKIDFVVGDISKIPCDAIVLSANPALIAGSGISGILHREAGPELEKNCLGILAEQGRNRLQIGEAIITPAFRLPCKYIIHAVGTRYLRDDIDLLRICYLNAFTLAESNSIASLAVPAISTGVYGVPVGLSAKMAKLAIDGLTPSALKKISFIFLEQNKLDKFKVVFSQEADG